MGLYEIWAKFQRHLWAGLGAFLSSDFSSILLVHSFVRFFIEFCVYALVLALFCDMWVDGAVLDISEMSKAYGHSKLDTIICIS